MVAHLYEWIENLAVYLVLVTAAIQVIPGNGYKKYIRFFTGLVLIFMIMSPVLKLFGMEGGIHNLYDSEEYQEQVERIESAAAYLEDVPFVQEESKEGRSDAIEVEEIQIGSGEMVQTDDE